MKYTTLLIFTTLLLSLSGCYSGKIHSSCAPDYAFKTIKTYQWTEPPRAINERPDVYFDPAVSKAMDQELALRGLRKKVPADALFYSYILLREEYGHASTQDFRTEPQSSAGITFNNKKELTATQPNNEVMAYGWEMGRLHIVMQDAESHKTIWNAEFEFELDRNQPRKKVVERLSESVEKMMLRFPATN